MKFILFLALIFFTSAAPQKLPTIAEFLTGEWSVYEAVPEKPEAAVAEETEEAEQVEPTEVPEAVESEQPEATEELKEELKEVKEEDKKEIVPIFQFNITKRTDVDGILDLLLPKKQNENEEKVGEIKTEEEVVKTEEVKEEEKKEETQEEVKEEETQDEVKEESGNLIEEKDENAEYYQVVMTDETTLDIMKIGLNEENDQTLATVGFFNASGIYVAEGEYEGMKYTITVPRTNALMMTITTQKKDAEGNVVIQTYIASKKPVDNRTFFQKYQMFIMMGIMMIMQTMTAPQMGNPQQGQGQAAPAQ